MKIKLLFLIFALLCAVVRGAWAQASWEEVYAMTGTTSADWTQLNASFSTGKKIGSTGKPTYYYADANRTFTNRTAGGSGLTIQGMVYLYVPQGVTVTCAGANADGQTGAGAGIELTAGHSLYLLGGGTVNATGGHAASGGNGANGDDAYLISNKTILGGSGGKGGDGGGGAGAGIGTRGANGGSGGSGGQRTGTAGDETTQFGVDGNAGYAGGTAGAVGSLFVARGVTVNATGGRAGSNGTGGNRGKTASQHPGSNVYMASGGGGGGAGGFGGAASSIGTGGPGGGGGGGGAAGNVAWVVYSGTSNGYYHAGAYGGNGGRNADGSSAPNGADVELSNPKYADIQGGGLRDKASDYDDDDGWEKGNGRHTGGTGGAAGNASGDGTVNYTANWPAQGTGAETDPYIISSTAEWNTFAIKVCNGINFSGQHVKLNGNISVSVFVGTDENNPFCGHFDGDGHAIDCHIEKGADFAAPFCVTENATFRNLTMTGYVSVTDNHSYLAGIIGKARGNTTLTNCRVSSTLECKNASSSDVNGGGFVGAADNVTFEGCVFDGKLLGSNACNSGGFGGYAGAATVTNSLFCPAEVTFSANGGHTFIRMGSGTPTINNSYYTQAYGTAQGSQSVVLDSAPDNLGNLVYDYGMVKAYENALLFGGKYYYGSATVTSESTTLTSGTYTVLYDVTIPERITIQGSVVLNLSANTTLHAPKGIELKSGNLLTIFGSGALLIDSCEPEKAGIGALAVGTLVVNNGHLNVKSNSGGAGIGGDAGNYDGGKIVINGGVVRAEGGHLGAGIGGGDAKFRRNDNGSYDFLGGVCGIIIINGGQVSAFGEVGIGPGYTSFSDDGSLTLNWTSMSDFLECDPPITSGKQMVRDIHLPSDKVLCFDNRQRPWIEPEGNGSNILDYGYGVEVTVGDYLDYSFTGAYYKIVPWGLRLGNMTDNNDVLARYNGQTMGVKLQDRNLYIDGKWNTLCLPFDMAPSKLPGYRYEVRTLTAASVSGATLNLTFSPPVTTTVKAGTPFIVRWNTNDSWRFGDYKFEGVTIDTADRSFDNGESGDGRVRFLGTYKGLKFSEADKSILFMGSNNMLYYPNAGAQIGAQHAYFKIGEDGAQQARQITAFNISFADGETTGIVSTEASSSLSTLHSSSQDWYTLDGRKLSGRPTAKGVYIKSGRKIIIK